MNTKINKKWALDYVDEKTKSKFAFLSDGFWKINISPSDVSDDWDFGDKILLECFTNYKDILFSDDGEIKLSLNKDDYKIGNVITILILNETKKESRPIYINFSDNMNNSFSDNKISYRIYLPEHTKLNSDESCHQISHTKAVEKVDSVNDSSWSTTTNSNTNFIIYNSNGNKATEYLSFSSKSPFEAIRKIVKEKKQYYTIRESTNTNKIVFKYEPNVKEKFYCFQYTNFYGCVGQDRVQEWTRGYMYTHIVRSDGYFGSNIDNISINGNNQPFSHSYSYRFNDPANEKTNRLEGNSGAYVYKFSNSTQKTKATMIVNLSESTLHYSSDQTTTFYSYINATSESNGWFTCDIGLAMSLEAEGNMQFVVNPSETCNIVWSDSSNDYTIATFDRNGTTFTTSQDIKIYFEVTNGCYHGKVYNYTTNITKEVWVYNSKIKPNNLVFLNATSLVPYTYITTSGKRQTIISDIKCGAYAKNIPILYPRLYTSSQNWDGNGTEFSPYDAQITDSLILYDLDHVSHSYNASQKREIINIDYTNNYKR